jgi:hypothetical protein
MGALQWRPLGDFPERLVSPLHYRRSAAFSVALRRRCDPLSPAVEILRRSPVEEAQTGS